MAINKYPYTDFHEMNLDWIIKKVKELIAEWASTKTQWTQVQAEWALTRTEFNELKAYVNNYFDNLDVQDEINNKLDAMYEDGSLLTLITPYVSSLVPVATSAWLEANIDPATGAVDRTLSVRGAAADAEVTGSKINNLQTALKTGNLPLYKYWSVGSALGDVGDVITIDATDDTKQYFLDALSETVKISVASGYSFKAFTLNSSNEITLISPDWQSSSVEVTIAPTAGDERYGVTLRKNDGSVISSVDANDVVTVWINPLKVSVDDTLSVAGAPADAKATGDQLTELKSALTDIGSAGVYDVKPMFDDTFDETYDSNTEYIIRYNLRLKKGSVYFLHVIDNGIIYKSNNKFIKIWSASANNVSAQYVVESFREDTEVTSGNLDLTIIPTADAAWLFIEFYLGAGESKGEVKFELMSSDATFADPYYGVVEHNVDTTFPATNFYEFIPCKIRRGVNYKLSIKPTVASFTDIGCIRAWTSKVRNVGTDYALDMINNSSNSLCGRIDKLTLPIECEFSETFKANYDAEYLVLRIYGTTSSALKVDFTISAFETLSEVADLVTGYGVVQLNKDVEPLVLQLSRQISTYAANHQYKRATFLFFSDIHGHAEQWERICDYMDYYSNFIPFAIHGGDYVSTDLGTVNDLYGTRKPNNGAILTIVGNHDCNPSGSGSPTAPIADTYATLYENVDPSADGWDCTMGTAQYAMYWYKDLAEEGVRIIGFDQYHWDATQKTFMENAFDDAITNGYAVVTVTHTPITTHVDNIGSGFWSYDNFIAGDTYTGSMVEIRALINAFVNGGGTHLVNLCGHLHWDEIGLLHDDGLFQIKTMAATPNEGWEDAARVDRSKTMDCFNVLQIDRNLGMIKMVRVGCNSADCLQAKTAICFDYVNKRLISNL